MVLFVSESLTFLFVPRSGDSRGRSSGRTIPLYGARSATSMISVTEFNARFRAASRDLLLRFELFGGVVTRIWGLADPAVSVKGPRLSILSRGVDLSLCMAMSRCFRALTRSCLLCLESLLLTDIEALGFDLVSSISPTDGELWGLMGGEGDGRKLGMHGLSGTSGNCRVGAGLVGSEELGVLLLLIVGTVAL